MAPSGVVSAVSSGNQASSVLTRTTSSGRTKLNSVCADAGDASRRPSNSTSTPFPRRIAHPPLEQGNRPRRPARVRRPARRVADQSEPLSHRLAPLSPAVMIRPWLLPLRTQGVFLPINPAAVLLARNSQLPLRDYHSLLAP